MSKLEYKVAKFQLKSADDDGRGEFSGCANFSGFLDDGGDIIPSGGFDNVIRTFLKGGFIAHSHEWSIKDGVVGYPVEAHEDEDGLFIRGKFHSDDDSQKIRTKIKERQDDGLDVGLSIGYRGGAPLFVQPKDYEKELPKYLKPEFLAEGLQKARKFKNVRVLRKLSELKEVSFVTSPMNILSAVGGVKSMEGQMNTVKFAPLETVWDAAAADQRIRDWAEKQTDPLFSYASSFLLPDKKFGRHQFPISDIIDDELVLVEKAMQAAAEQMAETKLSDSDCAKIRGRISAYYTKLQEQFPEQEVKTDWDNELDDVCAVIQQQAYEEVCGEIGAKIGARNASVDKTRIKQMHDLSVQMQPDVCPGYGSKECSCMKVEEDVAPDKEKEPEQSKEQPKEQVTDLSEWKHQKFRTERLRTAALRQRAGLNSGLKGGA